MTRKALTTFLLAVAGALSACRSTPNLGDSDLRRLQGAWEGDGAGGKCSITIAGNTLHYQAGTNWWKTRFTLPAATEPRQLHATILDSAPPASGIGTVVFAIFRIEGDLLTLAETDGSDKPPESFAAATSRYTLRRVPSPKRDS